MEKKAAESLIKDTFNAKFNLEQYNLFLRNLLNDYDEDKEREWAQGNYIYESFREHINRFKRLGIYTDPEGNEVELLIIETKATSKLERARTSLRNFVIKRLNDKNRDYALAAFYSKEDNGEDWRFSYIKIEHESYKDQKGKVKTKKELTPAKRFSFLVGEHEHAYTAQKQLLPVLQNDYSNPNIEDLESCFSIEKVTDEFFEQYKELYLKLSEHFSNDKFVQKILTTSGIDSNRFTKKLLGQIVFLYFLQKKGWLGVPKNEPWGKGEKKFMQALYDEAIGEKQNFFKDYLQYLFYEALAKARTSSPDPSYYKRFDCKIPFLNGGLFEADYDWQNVNLTIPNNLFRNDEKNKAGDKGTGILDVFDRYNFTIKEDEPLEKEVAVDPEMLGKVFENMLEITERKSKGAFYTPREIVHYMCQESLINYLDNAVNDATDSYQAIDTDQLGMFEGAADKKRQTKIQIQHKGKVLVPKEDIELFVHKGFLATENDLIILEKGKETSTYRFQLPESVRTNADLLDEKLTNIKICDPAIGSGAFPVGLLHELVTAQRVLLPYLSEAYLNKKLQEIDLDKADFKKDPAKYIYRVKRHAIQESIYGVDIDASAIDIARLRLWLSLIVDEEDFYSIEALPNLDYKIVRGNSVIGLPAQGTDRYPQIKEELEILKAAFFKETDEKKKKPLRIKIDAKINQVLKAAQDFEGYVIDFDFKLLFSEVWHKPNNGFDIIIANPPYISNWSLSKDNREQVVLLEKLYKEFLTGHWDIFLCFIAQGINILKNKGICTYILPTSFYKEKHSTKIREIFVEQMKVLELLDFEEEVIFDDVARQTGIFQVRKEKVSSNNISVKNGLEINKRLVPQHFFRALKNYAFKLNVTSTDITLYDKINKNSERLGHYVCVNTGVVAHSKAGSPISFKKDDVIYDKYKEGFKPYVIGSNIARFKIGFKGDYIDYDSKQNYFHRPKFKLLFESPKIIVRRISGKNNAIIACYDENQYYSNDNLMHLIHWNKEVLKYQQPEKKWNAFIKPELSLKYMLSIITSSFFTYYFSKFLSTDTLQGTYSSIYPEDLRQIPIKVISEKEQIPFVILSDYLLFLHEQDSEQIILKYFDNLLDGAVLNLFFAEEFKLAQKTVITHLDSIKPIEKSMSADKKLAIIKSEFNRLYDPNHPVRNNIETLDSVEEVRIIKEALK